MRPDTLKQTWEGKAILSDKMANMPFKIFLITTGDLFLKNHGYNVF